MSDSKSVIASIHVASSKNRRFLYLKEKVIEFILFLCAVSSVLVTVGIAYTLISEALPFFSHVSLKEFLTGTQWSPVFENPKFGILPLLAGTVLSSLVALSVAIPCGLTIAALLSEYAKGKKKEFLKPALELLAAVPTVVYGYFALLFVTPLLQKVFPELPGFNVLSAGLVMGIMIIPYIASLTEDAMTAVPKGLREGAMALGSTRLQTTLRVVIPSAFSGIASACILGISRAFGETMVVAIAAGMQPNFTFNPLEPAATITAFIVQVSLGDLPHGSVGFQSIYAAGLTLMTISLVFNCIGFYLRKRFREIDR